MLTTDHGYPLSVSWTIQDQAEILIMLMYKFEGVHVCRALLKKMPVLTSLYKEISKLGD